MTMQVKAHKRWEPVSLPFFVVVTKKGIRYTANHVSFGISDGDCHPTVAFQCSGRMYVHDAAEVKNIEYYPARAGIAGICTACDQVNTLVGHWVDDEEHRA